jgi:hypothetical protein
MLLEQLGLQAYRRLNDWERELICVDNRGVSMSLHTHANNLVADSTYKRGIRAIVTPVYGCYPSSIS